MPTFAVLFTDDPTRAETRQRHMADHLAFLDRSPAIRAAGPLTEAGQGAGGLWLVDAHDEAEVARLVQTDPFWPTGLRASVRILEWRQVHADGQRM